MHPPLPGERGGGRRRVSGTCKTDWPKRQLQNNLLLPSGGFYALEVVGAGTMRGCLGSLLDRGCQVTTYPSRGRGRVRDQRISRRRGRGGYTYPPLPCRIQPSIPCHPGGGGCCGTLWTTPPVSFLRSVIFLVIFLGEFF